jgi:hypothetical protein
VQAWIRFSKSAHEFYPVKYAIFAYLFFSGIIIRQIGEIPLGILIGSSLFDLLYIETVLPEGPLAEVTTPLESTLVQSYTLRKILEASVHGL